MSLIDAHRVRAIRRRFPEFRLLTDDQCSNAFNGTLTGISIELELMFRPVAAIAKHVLRRIIRNGRR